MKKIGLCSSAVLFITCSLSATPVVEAVLPGLLGNRFFVYCVGKVIAEELGFKFYSKSIAGFSETYKNINNAPTNKYPTEFINGGHDIDLQGIINNRSLRNIRINGYFQRYKYFKKYSKKIRNEWLKVDPAMPVYVQDPNDIVLHIRTNNSPVTLPFSYYEKALSMATYNRLFICTDEPKHLFLDNFKKYNPIIRSTRSLSDYMNASVSWDEIAKINLDDFLLMRSFNKIIISQSTFSWWAGFLSNATEIYAPSSPDERYQVYGIVEEERYRYITTTIGSY